MSVQSNRLPGIEFFRFYFILWICLCHIWKAFNAPHVNFGVEYFFIVAGFFLYQSFSKKRLSFIDYAVSRWKRLFPVYFVGLVLAYVINVAIAHSDGSLNILNFFFDFIVQASFLFETGFFHSPSLQANALIPLWFVGVLFVASLFLYLCLCCNRCLSLRVFFPLFSFVFFAVTFTKGLHLTDFWGVELVDGMPFLLPALGRGLAEMCVGIEIAALFEKGCFQSVQSQRIFNVLSIVAVVLLSAYAFFIEDYYEPLMLVMMIILVIALAIPSLWLNQLLSGKIWLHLGSITYEMLCLHMVSRYIINGLYAHFSVYRILWVVAYIILTILLAELVHWGLAGFPSLKKVGLVY